MGWAALIDQAGAADWNWERARGELAANRGAERRALDEEERAWRSIVKVRVRNEERKWYE
jgi:hypothetical protein